MLSSRKTISTLALILGDALLLALSLYVTLLLRYGRLPGEELLAAHFSAFGVLFLIWIMVYFIAGLYDWQSLMVPGDLWQRITKTQLVNTGIAILFFYTIAYFAITPKTNLFIFLVVSSALLVLWRYMAVTLYEKQAGSGVILIGGGGPVDELKARLRTGRFGLRVHTQLDPASYTAEELYVTCRQILADEEIAFIVIDRSDPDVAQALTRLHSFLYTDNIHFLSMDELFERVFRRVPIERLGHEWLVENIHRPHAAYDTLKRGMDITMAIILGLISLPLYPLVYLAIVGTGEGTLFSAQKRVGRFSHLFVIYKFRTMLFSDKTVAEGNAVTTVGWWLRKLRIDELPQIINVLKGDLSFIGPRPETPALVEHYEKEIPFHNARELIKPGLSGWAQLKQENPPKFAADTEKAREKLSYDLYYVKNRSLLLDIKITLQTLQVLASRSGR